MSEAQMNSGFGGAGGVAGMPRKIGFIHPASFFHLADLADPVARAFELRDLYAPQLTWESVADLDSLYVAARHRPDTVVDVVAPVVRRFLAEGQGRKVFIDGENRVGDWLDGTSEEPRECVARNTRTTTCGVTSAKKPCIGTTTLPCFPRAGRCPWWLWFGARAAVAVVAPAAARPWSGVGLVLPALPGMVRVLRRAATGTHRRTSSRMAASCTTTE